MPLGKEQLVRGARFGRFLITSDRRLGSGGFGEVWEAVDTSNGQPVALKLHRLIDDFDRPELRERVEREIVVSALVGTHPHLVGVHEADWQDGVLWAAMDLAATETLTARLKAIGSFQDEREFAQVMAQLCSAVAALHDLGDQASSEAPGGPAVHRDVKPANVAIAGEGADVEVTLIDLGSIKVIDGTDTRVIGSDPYIPPDLVLDRSELTPAADVYSLAALAWTMLAGSPPYGEPGGMASLAYLARAQVGEIVVPLPAGWQTRYDEVLRPALDGRDAAARGTARALGQAIADIAWDGAPPEAVLALLAAESPVPAAVAEIAETLEDGEATALVEVPTRAIDLPTRQAPRPAWGVLRISDRIARSGDPVAAYAHAVLSARARDGAAGKALRGALAAQSVPAMLSLAAGLRSVGREREAVELWTLADGRGSPGAAFELGRVAQDAGELQAAERHYSDAVARGSSKAALPLAQLREQRGDTEQLAHLLTVAARGGTVEARLRLADLAVTAGDYTTAELEWRRADRLGSSGAAAALGRLHEQRGDRDAAVAAFERAIDRGSDEQTRLEFSDLLWGAGERTRALDVLGSSDQELIRLAERLLMSERVAAARQLLERATPSAEQRRLLAACDVLQHRSREALERLGTDLPSGGEQLTRHVLIEASARSRLGDPDASEPLRLCEDLEVEPWLLRLAEPVLSVTTTFAAVAALQADLLRHHEAAASQVLDAYARATRLGSPRAANWVAYLADVDRSTKRGLLRRAARMGSDWAAEMLGSRLAGEGEFGEGRQLLEQAGTPKAKSWLAYIAAEEGRPAEQRSLLAQADREGSAYAAAQMAELHAAQRGWRSDEVLAALSRADLRGDVGSSSQYALLLRRRGHPDLAMAAMRRADRRGDAIASYNLGAWVEQSDEAEAEAAYRRAIARGAKVGYAGLAGLELKHGNPEAALELAEEAGREDLGALYCLGRALEATGRLLEAIDAYDGAAALGSARAAYDCARLSASDVAALRFLQRAEELMADDKRQSILTVADVPALRRDVRALKGRLLSD